MAENKKEEVVENTTKDNITKVNIDKKITKEDDNIIKVDLTKKLETDAVPKQSTDEVSVRDESETSEKVLEENVESTDEKPTGESTDEVQDDQPVVEEITEEEVKEDVKEQVEELTEQAEEAVAEAEQTGKPLPENIQKLVDFMNETGGSLEDYVKLNQDYSKLDNISLLKEYYKQTKPHLNSEEIEFMMEDAFSFDEEEDEPRDIKRKKLALKEQVAQAKSHLENAKTKYYEEIQYGNKLTSDQQKAIDFFNRYNKESKEQKEINERQTRTFLNKTNQLFNKDFKGFEYNVGEKKFRFNVKNASTVKENQSDISNFIGKFLDKNNEIQDTKGYHKSLFTAMNPDAIAKHFYEQGKADALKESIAKSKNVSMDPRQEFNGQINTSGIKVKVLGNNSNDFKFRIKNKK
tara:strand:- start:195 stop:1415 length:1221 start_codon:yes stop_codon:yes gene_type:complete